MKTRIKVLWVFLGTVAIMVGALLTFIQSKPFANLLKDVASRYMPTDFGVTGNFSELSVKLIPPGVVIKNPAVVLKEKNPAGLPAGTKLDAQYIDVTFQFFQILTGAVTINAFAIHGATLKLDLDEKFFAAHEKQQPAKGFSIGSKFSWDNLVRFNFRSVSLVDSQVDIRIAQEHGLPVRAQAFAKELTVGKGTVEGQPSYDLAIDLQRALMDIGTFQHSISQFQASVELSSAGASIRNLSVQEGELNLHTNGQIRGNLIKPKSLKSELSYIVRGPISKWLDPTLGGRFVKLPKGVDVDGVITVEGKATGDLMDIERTLEVKTVVELENARYSDWLVDKARVNGRWKGRDLSVDEAELQLGEGKVRVKDLSYQLGARAQTVPVKVELDNADFRKLLGPVVKTIYPLHMLLSGNADVEVGLGDALTLEGGADLVVRKFSFDNQKPGEKRPLNVLFAIPQLALKSKFSYDADGFEFDQTEVTLPRSKLRAFGKVDSSAMFDIDVKGPVDLADIGKLSAFDISGAGDLHWTIKGRKPDVSFGFEADLEGGKYLNLELGKVKGKVVYNDGNDMLYFQDLTAIQGRSTYVANGTIDTKHDDANMTVQVPRGTVQDFAEVFTHFIDTAVPWYPRELTGQLTGTIRVTGKTPLDQLSVEGDMELGNVDYQREIFRNGRVHAGYRRGAYIAENIFVRKKNGSLKGNLVFGADDVIKWDLRSDGLSTLDIDNLAGFGIPYRAPLNLVTQGVGKLGQLKSTFHLSLAEGMIKTYAVQRSEIDISTENGRVNGDVSVFGGEVRGKLNIGWEKGSSSTMDIEARSFDFQPVLIGLNPGLADDPELNATLNAAAHLKFQTGSLSRLSGNVALSSYDLRRRGYTLSLAKPAAVDITNGNYRFENVRWVGEGTAITATGQSRDGAVDYSVKGSLNLGFFEFLVAELASVRGSAQVDAKIYGRADNPGFRAQVEASGLDIRLRDIEQPFEDARFKADWLDSSIKVSGISAKFAGGQMRGDGTIGLHPYKVPELDFRMEMDNSKVKVYPVVYARTSGKLALRGGQLPYKVKGQLSVAEALIKENFNVADSGRALRSSKFLPQKSGSATGDVQIFDLEVGIAADRGVFVKNDLFDAEVKGKITVINSIQAPRVMGEASVLHGRLLFKDNSFTIQSGNLFFRNPAALDPEFDMSGQAEVKGYKILLVANGQASNPNITFQSQPPLSQNDVVNLLTLGVTSSGYQNIARENREAYTRDEMYNLMFNQSGVNKGLQQKFGVKVRVDQSQVVLPENAFRARSSADATETVAPKVVVQKEVTKNLNASLGSTVGIGVNQERNVNLEYDITKNLSVLGTYEDQRGSQPSQSRTSVGADLKYKLRFK